MMSNITVIPSDIDISGIEKFTRAADGNLMPVPVKELQKFSWEEIRCFMHKYGLYTFPTTELIEYLARKIEGRTAIEIGAGLGIIGRSLGIPVTDNKMQSWPNIKAIYAAAGQPAIQYPPDIEELDALSAIKKYKPDIVIGSYITHLWRPGMDSGNAHGVDNIKAAKMVGEYYMIGNLETHHKDPAMKNLDGVEQHDFLYTRGNISTSVIFRWKR